MPRYAAEEAWAELTTSLMLRCAAAEEAWATPTTFLMLRCPAKRGLEARTPLALAPARPFEAMPIASASHLRMRGVGWIGRLRMLGWIGYLRMRELGWTGRLRMRRVGWIGSLQNLRHPSSGCLAAAFSPREKVRATISW
jgi:hypothetical protein